VFPKSSCPDLDRRCRPHVTRRIIEFGTGWGAPIPWPIDKFARNVTRIKEAAAEAGRDTEALRFAAGLRRYNQNLWIDQLIRGAAYLPR
jgi:hypothetical protein